MKILHVIPKFPYSGKIVVGGAANSLYNIAKSQSKENEVGIISYFPSFLPDQKKAGENLTYIPLIMHSRPNSVQFGFEFILQSLILSREVKGKYDLLHGHSGHIDYILPLFILSKLLELPLIYSLHCPISLNSHVTKFPGRKILITSLNRNVNKFIAISHNVSTSMQVTGISKERITVIPPAIDINKFSYQSDKLLYRKKLNLLDMDPIFLFVGSVAPTKNLETVVFSFSKVLREMPKALLIITTELKLNRYRDREKQLSKLIEDLHLKNSILQMGIINNMHEVMAAADVLLAPFRSTDGPSDYFLAALEAMSVGRPVVVSPVGGMKEVVDSEVGVFASPEDSEQLADAMFSLLSDNRKREKMGVTASGRIKTKFNPEVISREIDAVYREMLHNANR